MINIFNFLKKFKFEVDTKLKDGTIIRIKGNDIVPGNEVYIVSEDGEIKLLAGEYTLENDIIIVVDDNGVITEVKEPIKEEEKIDEEVMEEIVDVVDDKQDPNIPTVQDIEKINNKLKQLEEKINSLENNIKIGEDNFSKDIKNIKNILEKTPGEKPVQKNYSEENINKRTLADYIISTREK